MIEKVCGVPVIAGEHMLMDGKPVIIPIGHDNLPLPMSGGLTIDLAKVKCFIAHPDIVEDLRAKIKLDLKEQP